MVTSYQGNGRKPYHQFGEYYDWHERQSLTEARGVNAMMTALQWRLGNLDAFHKETENLSASILRQRHRVSQPHEQCPASFIIEGSYVFESIGSRIRSNSCPRGVTQFPIIHVLVCQNRSTPSCWALMIISEL
jgi:hypothetical protein